MAANDLPEALLQAGLRPELMPRHVAFVPDGHRRWAQARGLTKLEGYEAGAQAFKKIVELSSTWGIHAITVFAFSTENLGRPEPEINFGMELMELEIREQMDVFAREGIRVHFTGDRSRMPHSLQDAVREAEEMTRNNSRLHVIFATGYGGRWDIVQACRELATKVQDKELMPEDIDEAMVASHISTNVLGPELACPDLIIRTSGEMRLSNFLLWQAAYSELYFPKTLWPDFGEDEYLEVLKDFQSRERRYGQRMPSKAE
ncbi:unnamed protein product [Urochloa humidicola]